MKFKGPFLSGLIVSDLRLNCPDAIPGHQEQHSELVECKRPWIGFGSLGESFDLSLAER